jgi:V/A-type H+-transporting ATPase subunit D
MAGATDVNPTRMELIKTKDRIKLAGKGHKLLKQKRDALILEFFKILKKAQDLRGQLAVKMGQGYRSIALAETYHNIQELSKVSRDLRRDIDIDIQVRNVMGVKIPNITTQMEERNYMQMPNYSVAATSAKIDSAVEDFSEILQMVIKLAETETAMKRLIVEIEKTKRRVNALEFVLIPRLEEQKKMISFRLEEMERDSFVSLKTIKRKLEKDKKAKAAAQAG